MDTTARLSYCLDAVLGPPLDSPTKSITSVIVRDGPGLSPGVSKGQKSAESVGLDVGGEMRSESEPVLEPVSLK